MIPTGMPSNRSTGEADSQAGREDMIVSSSTSKEGINHTQLLTPSVTRGPRGHSFAKLNLQPRSPKMGPKKTTPN